MASRIGLGTWVLGGGRVWGRDPDDAESIRVIHAALDHGITLIDTAPAYGWGRSEEIVGKAIKGRRDSVILATKCGLWTDDDRGSFFTELDGRLMRRSLRPDTIEIEVERSLRRLGVETIDLYQTHWPSTEPDFTPIADTIACLLKLRDAGKIRTIGVCNVGAAELEENHRCAGPALVGNQFRYSMLQRDAERDILPLCARHQLATLTYMSLEQGLLAGKVPIDRVFAADEFRSNEAWNPWYALANRRRLLTLLDSWQDLTARLDCSLAQLVLAWTLARPGVTHVLCGARTLDQLEDNAGAARLVLPSDVLDRIESDLALLGPPQSESP
jgi:methylglyoxal reductase